MNEIIVSITSGVIIIWLGSIEWRIRTLAIRSLENPSRREVTAEINARQESLKVLQTELKEDIKRIENKLDRLLDRS